MRRENILAIYDRGVWVGDYRASDAVDYIGTTRGNLLSSMHKGYLIKHRYSLDVVDTSLLKSDEALEEFDYVVGMIKSLLANRRKTNRQ